MHDDPTRMMGQPEHPGGPPRGNVRLLIAGLIAVIVGLVLAIVVIASDSDGGGDAGPVPSTITTEPTTDETTTEPTTTESTETEATETTTTETTTEPTTTPPTTTEEEENGSGGILAE